MKENKTKIPIRNYSKRLKIVYRILLFLFICLFQLEILGQSQEIEFEYLNVEHGLSQGSVCCILQDHIGFMFFGTQNGLNRFDGHTFKVYTHDPKDTGSLSHDIVISLCEDEDKIIWIGTWGGGLNRYERETDKFVHFRKTEQKNSLSNDNVFEIYEDSNSNLWIGTGKGINLFDRKKEIFIHYLEAECVNSIVEDKWGTLLVGTENGLFYFDSQGKKFQKVNFFKKNKPSTSPNVTEIYKDKSGILWIGTQTGLYKFEGDKKQLKILLKVSKKVSELKDSKITSLHRDFDDRLWIGTSKNGLLIYDIHSGHISKYEHKPNFPHSLSHNDVKAIFKDKSDLIWIGTNGGGINKFDPNRKKFTLYKNETDNPSSLSHDDIMAIFRENDDSIWISTWGKGIDRFVPDEQKFYHYEIPESVSNLQERHYIRAICQDHSGIIWIGTSKAGLFSYIPEEEKFNCYQYADFKKDEILSLSVDDNDNIWVGCLYEGLFKIFKDRKKHQKYISEKKDLNTLSCNTISSLYKDTDGSLWIGTERGGLNHLDIGQEKFTRYLPSKSNPKSISHNFVSSIYRTKNGTLWIGTSRGLNELIDEKENSFHIYTKKDGLPDNVIYAIQEDNNGNLWLSTNRGLSRFNPEKKEFRNYTPRDGLQGYEFNRNAACKTSNRMLFGGINGLNIFDPENIGEKERKAAPTIVITALKKLEKNNQITIDTTITTKKNINLSYKDDFVSFQFAALSFANPTKNRYKYKLDPINDDWIYLGTKHEIDFLNLEPGKYKLGINGANSDGIWNDKGTYIDINIPPPFWLDKRYVSITALFLLSFAYIMVRRRIKVINEKRKILEDANSRLNKEVITRQQAEDSLRESENRYRSLVETSPDAITLCDIKGNISMANRQTCKLLGYSHEEILKDVKNILKFLPVNQRSKARQCLRKVIKEGATNNIELTLIAKDGTPIPVEISTSYIKNGEGKTKYFIEMARDIRKRKEAEQKEKIQKEKLIQVEKMASLGRLISGVAHELNNPASSLKMNSEIFDRVWRDIIPVLDAYSRKNENFKMGEVPYVEAKSRLDDLIIGFMESSQRIEKIIKDLNNFSRPVHNVINEPVDINKVVRSSVNLLHNLLKKSTKHFSLKLTENLPTVLGNFQKLEQVMINLIQNACQALPDNSKRISTITTLDKKKKQIIILVEDEGSGIDENDLKYITDPFYTTRRNQGGSGLGLSISQQIIQEHKGVMKFESQPGKGTTVKVCLPVYYLSQTQKKKIR